jgi:flagellar hook-length control protein FliK
VAATVAKAAEQAQAIQGQAEAASAAQAGGNVANTALTQDSLAAALVQAEQTVATKAATASVGRMVSAAAAKGSDGNASLPANPLGIVLPSVTGAGKAVVAKAAPVTKAAPSAASTAGAAAPAASATGKTAKPAGAEAAKAGNARLSAAVAGNSLNHDVAMAAAQVGQGPASGATILAGAQSATAADVAAGANLAMPANLADQIAGQLPLDGAMPGLITIHLNPPELGRLQLTFENDSSGGVAAVIRAENPDTLAQLRQEMPSVMEKITDSGVNLKRVEVSLSGQQGNATDSPGREGMWQQARQEQPLRWGAYEEDAPAPEAAAASARSSGWTSSTGLNVWM